MSINLALELEQEARLTAAAEARGMTPTALIYEAVERMLSEVPERTQCDSRPLWQVIEENRNRFPADLFDDSPVDGASEHDHYLYGSPKKNQ